MSVYPSNWLTLYLNVFIFMVLLQKNHLWHECMTWSTLEYVYFSREFVGKKKKAISSKMKYSTFWIPLPCVYACGVPLSCLLCGDPHITPHSTTNKHIRIFNNIFLIHYRISGDKILFVGCDLWVTK